MNRTKIEWTDYTWSPVTGCWGPGGTAEKPKRCAYCYAEKVAWRFYRHHIDKVDPVISPAVDPFAPQFYPDRLSEPSTIKKPSRIFVCSMADLFGDWVPEEWILKVLLAAAKSPHHTFQFLTKNPKRLKDFPFTSNCWVGTTVTNQADADERLPWLLQVEASVRFVSHEPLLGTIDLCHVPHPLKHPKCTFPVYLDAPKFINWAIIGAMTGPGAVKPDPAWIQGLLDQYRAAGVPVFLKDNLKWPEKVQEWPATRDAGEG